MVVVGRQPPTNTNLSRLHIWTSVDNHRRLASPLTATAATAAPTTAAAAAAQIATNVALAITATTPTAARTTAPPIQPFVAPAAAIVSLRPTFHNLPHAADDKDEAGELLVALLHCNSALPPPHCRHA